MSQIEISTAIGPNTDDASLLRIAHSFQSARHLDSAASARRAADMRAIITHPNVGDYTLNVLSNFFNAPPDFQIELAGLIANHPKGANALNQGMHISHAAPENRVAIGLAMVGGPKLSYNTFSQWIIPGFRSGYYIPGNILEFHDNITRHREEDPEREAQKHSRTKEGLQLARAVLKSKLMDAKALVIMMPNFSLFPQVLEGIVNHPKADERVLDRFIKTYAERENCVGVVKAAVDIADKKGYELSKESLIKSKAAFPSDSRFRFVNPALMY